MTARGPLREQVERQLGERRLVWAGLRGDDVEPLADLPQLSASFSLSGRYSRRGGVDSVAYEELTGVRVDPEVWDIDNCLRDEATVAFRRDLLRALGTRSALLPYRPSQFLSAVHFARQDMCLNLGLFGAHQSAFEHKPWVESAVADLALPHIPWSYVADDDQLTARELAGKGALVLRRSRTSGGQGFIRVESADRITDAWPDVDEAFVSVAPYLDGGLPVNVGATVWRDGVTVHHPSIQLIGLASCVTREFGYCGNDFGQARDLDAVAINQIERSTMSVGQWLREHGYVGSFGVDFLIHDGQALFTEVNPRFQGSTHASCRLSAEAGEACLMLEHVAAWLGVPCPDRRPLAELVASTPDLTNLVVHWTGDHQAELDAFALIDRMQELDPGVRYDSAVPDGVLSDPGSLVARFMLRRSVTKTGFDLDPRLDALISDWQRTASTTPTGGDHR